jgi:DNA repair exonuclease SbcCD nuclease subunit
LKIIFSADWHIKLGQKNVPVDWAKNRYRTMFKQIHGLEKTNNMHVIGGDVFDRVPTMEELELYFEFIAGCSIRTIIFAGNHESVKKHTTFFTQLKKVTSSINKNVEIIDDFYSEDNWDIIPYNCLKQYNPQDIDFHGDILFTHVRGEIPPHVKAEVDLKLFERWKVVFAGDLHSHSNSQLNIIYPGSPVTTSFHRNKVDTGVLLIDSVTCEYTWHKLEVPQLIRKTIVAGEPMLAGDYDHVIYEITGDMDELGNVEDSELIDKKVVKRTTDCALILAPEMTVQQELSEYLEYILQLPEDTIEEALKEFNDSIKGSI